MTTERVRVGEVLRLQRIPVDPDPLTDYVSIGIRSFGKGIFHYEPLPGDKLGKLRFFGVEPDRLIVSNIKGWEGAVAVSTSDDDGCIASSRFLAYVPIDERISVRWARWFFLSEFGNELLQRASPGSADRNRTLAIDRFEALEIPLLPIDEQQRVALRLDHVEAVSDELRERAARASELADAFAVSTASRADLDQPAKIGSGWRRERLGEVMQPANASIRVDAAGTYPNVGIYSFGRGLFEKPPIDGAATSATTLNRVVEGQFIYSRLFAFECAYAYVSHDFDGYYVSNEFPTFDPDPDALDARWLATVFRSRDIWAELAGRSKGLGVRRRRVPVEAVLGYELWLPPIDEQQAMVSKIAEMQRASTHRREVMNRVHALLPAAVNEAFAGLS